MDVKDDDPLDREVQTPGGPRHDVALRKRRKKIWESYTIQCGIGNLVPEIAFRELIQKNVQIVSLVRYELCKFANLHLLRLLESNLPIPQFDLTFFDQLMYKITIGKGKKALTKTAQMICSDVDSKSAPSPTIGKTMATSNVPLYMKKPKITSVLVDDNDRPPSFVPGTEPHLIPPLAQLMEDDMKIVHKSCISVSDSKSLDLKPNDNQKITSTTKKRKQSKIPDETETKTEKKNARKATKIYNQSEIDKTAELYKAARLNIPVMSRSMRYQLIQESIKEYETACKNNICTNFVARSKRYFRLKVKEILHTNNQSCIKQEKKDKSKSAKQRSKSPAAKSKKKTNVAPLKWNKTHLGALVHSLFLTFAKLDCGKLKTKLKTGYVLSDVTSKLLINFLKDCQTRIGGAKYRPWLKGGGMQKNWSKYFPWFYHILKEITSAHEKQKSKKVLKDEKGEDIKSTGRVDRGLKLFSLLPHCKLRATSIHITPTTLYELLRQHNVSVTMKKFHAGESTQWWYKMFRLNEDDVFDTPNAISKTKLHGIRNREFAKSIKTNGVVCGVLFERRRKNILISSNDDSSRSFEDEKLVPPPKAPDHVRVIGLDPGRRDLFVAIDQKTCTDGKSGVVKCSTKRYYHLIGQHKSRKKRKKWLNEDKFKSLKKIENKLPTPKVCTSTALIGNIGYLSQHFDIMTSFNFNPRTTKLRWKIKMQKLRVLDRLCREILDGKQVEYKNGKRLPKPTVVGFGNGSFSSSSAGHASGPVKALCVVKSSMQIRF